MNTTTSAAMPFFRTPVIVCSDPRPRAPETGTPHTCAAFVPRIPGRIGEARSAVPDRVVEGLHLRTDPGQLDVRHAGGRAVQVGELDLALHHRAGLQHRD